MIIIILESMMSKLENYPDILPVLLLALTLLVAAPAFAQGDFLWVTASSGVATLGDGIAVDALGNIIIMGKFERAVTSVGEIDIFDTQYAAAGNPLWSRGMGPS